MRVYTRHGIRHARAHAGALSYLGVRKVRETFLLRKVSTPPRRKRISFAIKHASINTSDRARAWVVAHARNGCHRDAAVTEAAGE